MIIVFRRLLIRLGKCLPFVLCGAICVSCVEMLIALATHDFISYNGTIILNTPISFAIGLYFEYDTLVCVLSFVLSIAIAACKWNLWATFYLLVHLMEKSYFDFELDEWQIYVIAIANLIVSGYFTYKGIKILLTHK